MRVMLASLPGRPEARNDDWGAATATGVAVVLDGLTESGPTGCEHGTGWYVHQLGTRLLMLAADTGRSLAEVLADGIDQVATLHRGGCDLTHPGSPAATVAILRPQGTSADYLVLSDAVVLLDNAPEPLVVTDTSVRDHLAELTADTGRPGGLTTLIEAQQHIRNTAGGYWVAQHDPGAAEHAVTGSASGLVGAALLSDGAAMAVTDFGAMTWRELIDVAYQRGPADVLAATRELELRDPNRTVWPRYKTHDDATMIVCQT
jgi:hypothetical protein